MLLHTPVRKYLEWLLQRAEKSNGHTLQVPTTNAYDIMSLADEIKCSDTKTSVNLKFGFEDIDAQVDLRVYYKTKSKQFEFILKRICLGDKNIRLATYNNPRLLMPKIIDDANSNTIKYALPHFCNHVMPDIKYTSREMEVCMMLSLMYNYAYINQKDALYKYK